MDEAEDSAVVEDQVQEEVAQIEEDQQAEGETPEGEQAQDEQGADDEVTVSIAGESPAPDEEEQRAPEWVRDLRKSDREKTRRIRELEQQVQAAAAPAVSVAVGEKPTLEGVDYDTDRFETELAAYHQRKQDKAAEDQKKQAETEAATQAWQGKLDAYGKGKTELKVKDFEDAEATVLETLNVTQQGLILHAANSPALVVYALGKNTRKAKELASINDPVKFAFALGQLETQLKVTQRKAPPPPDKQIQGSAPVTGSVDSTLARLEKEADRTGDRSAIRAYNKSLKAKGK